MSYVLRMSVTALGKKKKKKITIASNQRFGIMSLQGTAKYANCVGFERGNKRRIEHRSIVCCLFQYSIFIEATK